MTIQEAQDKVIKIAILEDGYLEKASNAQLDSKTGNAGYNNYTKYARDHAKWGTYQASKQGLPWCDQFVDWCFITAFGFTNGMAMTCQPRGGYGAGCIESYNYYKSKGQTVPVSQAQRGDQIFFGSSGNMTHTGLITKVDGQYIYTVEGNTGSGDNTVIANGGGVFQKKYNRSYAKIAGIGRPKWDIVANVTNMTQSVATPTTKYKESTYLGGVYMEIPFDCIAHIEHVKMNTANGETIDSVVSRVKWNGKAPSIVINAELYTLRDMSPASGVKHHGTMEYKGWQPGIGFKDGKTPVWQSRDNATAYDWLGGYPAVVVDGIKKFDVPAGLGGMTYRTMMGLKDDTLGIIATHSGCSIDTVATKMKQDGYTHVINLDGGASTCYVTPEHMWSRQRRLRGYIAIWLTGGKEISTPATKPSQNNKLATMLHNKAYQNGKTMTVTANALNVRGQNGITLYSIPKGTKVQWYGYYTTTLPTMSGKFLWVSINGKTGFISAAYVK